MMTVPLHGKKAAGRHALVDDEKYELVMQYRWCVWEVVRAPGRNPEGPYAVNQDAGRMHRLILPGHPVIDHRDGNGLNNQLYNLRPATPRQNARNAQKAAALLGQPMSSLFK